MEIIYLLIMIISLSTCISVILKKDTATTIFPTMIIIVLWLYFFGIIKQLEIGCFSIIILSIVTFIYDIIKFKDVKKIFNISALIFLGIIFLISYLFFKNNHLSSWDEFTHWGTYVKNMFYYKSLGNDNFTSIANSYPPGISIFEYFLIFLSGKFKESTLYTALYIFTSSIFINLLENISIKNNKIKFLILLMISIVFPCLFSAANALESIYVDTVLGLIFVYCILYLTKKEISTFNLLNLSLGLAMLILIKDFGIVFAGAIYISLAYDILFNRKKEYITFYKTQSFKNKLLILFLFLFPILVKLSWMIYIKFNINISNSFDEISLVYPPYGKDVISVFLSTVFTNGIATTGGIIFIPTIYWIIISIFFSYLTSKEYNKKTIIASIIFISIIYILFLLTSYLFIFNEIEALKLASIGRYLVSLILAILGIPVYIALYQYINDDIKSKNVFAIIITFILITAGYYPFVNKFINLNNDTTNEFYEPFNNIRKANELLDNDNNIYYISIDSNGYDYFISKYLLTPIKTQVDNYDLYNFDKKGKISSDDFLNLLKNYDYVFIYKINDIFINDYGEIFDNEEIQENALYKIDNRKLIKIEL